MSTETTTPVPADDRLAPTELRAWRGMLRVHATLTKALDARLVAEHGLPLTSYEVLLFLDDAESCRMRMCDLADSVLLSRSGLTRLVDRLEKDGLLSREACVHDARGAFAKLTPAGRQKLRAARTTYLAGIRSLFLANFTEAEQETLGTLWERIVPDLGDCCVNRTHSD